MAVNNPLIHDGDNLKPPGIALAPRQNRAKQPLPSGVLHVVPNKITEEPSSSIGLYVGITAFIMVVIGGLVAMGLTGQFTSDGWVYKVAFPAIKHAFDVVGDWIKNTVIPAVEKFLRMKSDLTVGQGLAYIAAPMLGALILGALARKYGSSAVDCIQRKYAAYEAYRQRNEIIRETMEQEKSCKQWWADLWNFFKFGEDVDWKGIKAEIQG